MDDAIKDGIRRLEMSFDVRSAGHFETGFVGFTAFIRQLVERYREQIDLRPELESHGKLSATRRSRIGSARE